MEGGAGRQSILKWGGGGGVTGAFAKLYSTINTLSVVFIYNAFAVCKVGVSYIMLLYI